MEHPQTARIAGENSPQQRVGGGFRGAPRFPPPRDPRDDAQRPPYRTPTRPPTDPAPYRGCNREKVQLAAPARENNAHPARSRGEHYSLPASVASTYALVG